MNSDYPHKSFEQMWHRNEPHYIEDVQDFICDCCGQFEQPPVDGKCPRCKYPVDMGDLGYSTLHF